MKKLFAALLLGAFLLSSTSVMADQKGNDSVTTGSPPGNASHNGGKSAAAKNGKKKSSADAAAEPQKGQDSNCTSCPSAVKPATSTTISATITKVSEDKKSIEVDEPNKAKGVTYTLSQNVQDLLAKGLVLSQGDDVTLTVDEKNAVTDVHAEKIDQIPGGKRIGYLVASLLIFCIFSMGILALAGDGCLLHLIIGEDNRYSNSKFQVALWFLVVIVTYTATVFLRWDVAGGGYLLVDIPKNLLLLSGMSALTFAGAKAITTSKTAGKSQEAADAKTEADAKKAEAAEAAKAVSSSGTAEADAASKKSADAANKAKVADDIAKAKALAAKNAAEKPSFGDLLKNDKGQVDFGDFQMLIVTALAVCVYILQIYYFLGHFDYLKEVTLPDLDTTILSVFGLGQGAYLAKKAAGNSGDS